MGNVSIDNMALGNIGRVIAGQALESTKKGVMDALRSPEPAKPVDKSQGERPSPPPVGENIGPIILGQMQAMQRTLQEDQELLVQFHTGNEVIRVLEIILPSIHVFVLSGVDADQNVARVVIPAEAARLVFKVMKVAEGAKAIKVTVLSPRPNPAPAPAA
ncbi:MAG: hypothetical protein ABJC09_02105 [Terriglobia bacterium]